METPGKALIRKRFSRALDTYSEAADIQTRMADKLCSMITGYRMQFPNVLEIGAGTGLLTDRLDRMIGWNCRIVNDLAEECRKFHSHRDKTVFLPGDAEYLDWGQTFDLICSNAAFQWIADLPAFLKRLNSVSTSGGLLAFSSFGPDNLKELSALTGAGLHYYSVDELTSMLKHAGFQIQHAEAETNIRSFSDPLDILKEMRRTGVSASAGQSWWTPHRLADFREKYRSRFGNAEGGVNLTWNPVYVLAVSCLD